MCRGCIKRNGRKKKPFRTRTGSAASLSLRARARICTQRETGAHGVPSLGIPECPDGCQLLACSGCLWLLWSGAARGLCTCLRACACARLCLCVCLCVRLRACACVSVCLRVRLHAATCVCERVCAGRVLGGRDGGGVRRACGACTGGGGRPREHGMHMVCVWCVVEVAVCVMRVARVVMCTLMVAITMR